MELRTVNVTRYITPLREGGSLPALVEADDGFKYVLKFRGSGHGTKVLISELIGGVIAKLLGLNIPELVFINLDEAFGRSQRDEEIQDLLKASRGLNLGLSFLSGALAYDPVTTKIDSVTASKIVWMDAYLTNIDRTVRNTNMLMWHKELWLIDHGSMLYFHHNWDHSNQPELNPFPMIKDHVLLPFALHLEDANVAAQSVLSDLVLEEVVTLIPDEFVGWAAPDETPDSVRQRYYDFLRLRLKHSTIFLNEAIHAQKAFL